MDSEQVSGARHSRAPHFCASDLFSGLTNFAKLEQRIADLPTRQERGDAFEVFAEAYRRRSADNATHPHCKQYMIKLSCYFRHFPATCGGIYGGSGIDVSS